MRTPLSRRSVMRPGAALVAFIVLALALVVGLQWTAAVSAAPPAQVEAATPEPGALAPAGLSLDTPQPAGTPDLAVVATPAAPAAAPDAFPDLVIQSLTLQPSNPAPGQPATVTVVIKNVGTAPLWDGFYAYLYIDPPQRPPNPTTPDTNFVGWFLGLNPGATFTWSYTDYTFTTAGCDHVVYAWVDREDAIREESEQNNLGKLDVCVGGGQTGDRYEPDDTCDRAQPLTVNAAAQEHTFGPPGDVDWQRFDAVAGVEYLIRSENTGAGAEAALTLFPRCSLPASFGGSNIIPFTPQTSGVYYIKAVNNSNHATGDTSYKVSITSGANCTGFFEPNDSRATAKDITVGAAAQRHQFCKAGDEDWVKFAVRAGSSYTVRATGAGANPQLTGSLGDGGRELTGNPLEYTATEDGVLYVRITNQPPTAFGPSTEYDVTVTASGCTGDGFEPDNAAGQARDVTINGLPERRTACPAGDRDWVKFTATAGITYTLETVGLGAASDTILCLYDNGATQLACDDESGANHGSRITWQAQSGGVYYAEVRQADAAAAGPATEYEFSIVTGLCRGDLYEPDDSGASAAVLPADGSRQPRNFCATSDRDWARLQIPAAGWYTIETSELSPGSDTVLTLYAPDGATQLSSNDDFTLGTASRLVYNFSQPGVYYLEVRHYNPLRYGRSTAYFLTARPERAEVTPTPTREGATPTPTATTPPPSGLRTLILTHRAQLTAIYGAGRVAPLFERLTAFANHAAVQGEIVEVDGNPSVAAAYDAWKGDMTSVAKANAAAAAVRALVMDYLASRQSIQYIVLAGDDRVIPARRIKDRTNYPESEYTSLSTNTAVGAAISQDFFLTDDYYADREPSTWEGAEVYVPDWAIGRLIETPEEIASQITHFLAAPEITLGTATTKALVTGYDFVQDVATNIANDLLARDLYNGQVDAVLISDAWTSADFKRKQLNTTPAFKLQSINGHASHASQGAPVGSPITARDVISGSSDLSGAVIYSVGCHAGLNVPETSNYPLDLAQAFSQKRANYVANTGFGWGNRIAVQLSERLVQNYTQELLKGSAAYIGKALVDAKRRYHQEADGFEAKDEKVMQQFTLYGFPMYRVLTGATLGPDDAFPSAVVDSDFDEGARPASRGGEPATATGAGHGAVEIKIGAPGAAGGATGAGEDAAAGFTRVDTAWGSYYELDGHAGTQPTGPVQPRIYANLAPPAGQRLRGAVFTGGGYTTTTVDPAISAAVNEYAPALHEPAFTSEGFYPPAPFALHTTDTISATKATLAVVLGQTQVNVQRLYNDVRYDVYYSALDDESGPTITWIDGFYNTRTNRANFKIEATDNMTVTRVLIAYSATAGVWASADLAYRPETAKWAGELAGLQGAQYYVQAVDSAGNATAVTRKGGYFRLEDVATLSRQMRPTYLPCVTR